ncbi:MAG TPA: hypothetical protein VMH81_04565 [Bryobacteraceae bacterium]|nr:hypothetical protein [Bryobacteraceae bacterium]
MRRERFIALISTGWMAAVTVTGWQARAATFGQVVPISGQAADIALDEGRSVLYVANFTAARVDVLSLADSTLQTSLHVAPGPASLALSGDARFLIVTHFGNVQAPGSPSNAMTVIDLSSGVRQTYALESPPLGVAFGSDGMAMVATTTEFLRFDPTTGKTDVVDTVAGLTANSIPAAPGTAPVQIVAAALAASGDGKFIFGLTDTIRVMYDVSARHLQVVGYTASPPLGPRVVSVARDGSYYAAGWGLFNRQGTLLAQFGSPSGLLAVGSHAIDSASGILYAQIPQLQADTTVPAPLWIADSDNLTIRERLALSENLTGRAVLNARADTLYAVSESGVTILPVGLLNQFPRLGADQEDLVFRGSFCQSGAITRTLRITDPGGGQTQFDLSSDLAGVSFAPSSGRTPASVQVTIDPHQFQDHRGTVSGSLKITSTQSVNQVPPVRVLVNNQRPDERGSPSDVPGTLTDLLADPVRDRFYVIRQDRNQVLVFDGSGLVQVAQLRTSNTPTRMAITPDGKNLLVGHDNSQLVYVYDLDTLQQLAPVAMPAGHYPRSVAASGNAVLAASRVAGGTNTIDRIDLLSGTSSTPPSLGVFQNSVNADTALAAGPNGGSILAASADGNVWLYDASADTFTVSRKLPSSIAGAFAASASGQFVAGNNLLNAALKPTETWTGSDFPSGFAFLTGGQGLRLTGPSTAAGAGGNIARIDLTSGNGTLPTRVSEQPLASSGASVFTRTLAPLANGNTLIALTVSGFTALAWHFDAAVAPPAISQVVNAADLTPALAPGSLVAVFGANLSPTNMATTQIPLPTAIGESCLVVNGSAIPMMFASPGQINAQLPLHIAGRVPMTLYTPGGVSDDYYVNVNATAPAIFQNGTAGPLGNIPLVIKASNQQLVTPTNPIHPGDELWIYATGLGETSPEVPAGTAAPSAPPASALTPPNVQLGDVALSVSYAGLAPGEVGVYQINAKVPSKTPTGLDVPLSITQGAASASVTVRVVN